MSAGSGVVRAGCCAGTAVVAAVTAEGIYRAIEPVCFRPLQHAERLIDSVLHQIGATNQAGVTWTGYVYPGPPGYLGYGYAEGWPDIRDSERPSGVWLFRWVRPPAPTFDGATENKGVLLSALKGRRP